MWKWGVWFIGCLLLIVDLSIAQQLVTSVTISGINRTKEPFIHQFIAAVPGSIFDSIQLKEDVQELRNTHLFKSISYEMKNEADGIEIFLSFQEAIPILPYVTGAVLQDAFWIKAGVSDFNFLGSGSIIGGWYRYYNRHSFQFFFEKPVFVEHQFGYSFIVSKISLLEPVYFNDIRQLYNYDQESAEAMLSYGVTAHSTISLSANFSLEQYKADESVTEMDWPFPLLVKEQKALMKIKYDFDRLNYFYEEVTGVHFQTATEGTVSFEHNDLFLKSFADVKFMAKAGGAGNWGTRVFAGISSNSPAPFAPFIFDGFTNLRGDENISARGTAIIISNTEYRLRFYRNKWFAIQGILFLDAGLIRFPTEALVINSQTAKIFGGAGMRMQLFPFYNLVFRFDYGVNLSESNQHGFVLGLGQFF